MKSARFFFYLLILFLPTQLSRHFFFDFSFLGGIRSDYLAPTIYLTDILVGCIVCCWLFRRKLSPQWNFTHLRRGPIIFGLLLFYLLGLNLFGTVHIWPAWYKFLKILELFGLGFLIVLSKPKLHTTLTLLSINVLILSVLAIWQFLSQHSIGGVFWWLGERTFYASTPGIAAISKNGALLLRPYATFSHPNVLAGYLCIVLTLFSLNFRYKLQRSTFHLCLCIAAFLLGCIALYITFSRTAWVVFLVGVGSILFQNKILPVAFFSKKVMLLGFFLILILSVYIPLQWGVFPDTSVQERAEFLRTSLRLFQQHPIFGVGLNNSLYYVREVSQIKELFILQPIHNVYMLFLVETGIVGFILCSILFVDTFIKTKTTFMRILFFELFLLGLGDHYIFTLQQGQLLFVCVTALVFLAQDAKLTIRR